MNVPVIKSDLLKSISAEEVRILTSSKKCEENMIEKIRRIANVIATVPLRVIADLGELSPDPMIPKVAVKQTNPAAHALKELYEVPYFATKRGGRIETKNLPEIQITKKMFLKALRHEDHCCDGDVK